MTVERRMLAEHELRLLEPEERGQKGRQITGLGAVFYREGDPGTEYELWDGLVERMRPEAFDAVISERQDVRALFNHDPSEILGRTEAGTLQLRKTPKGLTYTVDLPDTERARDLIEHIRRGDISGSSIGFIPTAVSWERQKDGTEVRWIDKVELRDVGPVTFPAYEATSVAKRSIETEREEWLRQARAVRAAEKLKRAAAQEAVSRLR